MISTNNHFANELRAIETSTDTVSAFVNSHKSLTQGASPARDQMFLNLGIIRYHHFDEYRDITLQLLILTTFLNRYRGVETFKATELFTTWEGYASSITYPFKQRTKADLKQVLMQSLIDGLADDTIERAVDEYADIYKAIETLNCFFFSLKDTDAPQDLLLLYLDKMLPSDYEETDRFRTIVSLHIRVIEITLLSIQASVEGAMDSAPDHLTADHIRSYITLLERQALNLYNIMDKVSISTLNRICHPRGDRKFTFGLALSDALINTRRHTHVNYLLKPMWWATVVYDIKTALDKQLLVLKGYKASLSDDSSKERINTVFDSFHKPSLLNYFLSYNETRKRVMECHQAPDDHKKLVCQGIDKLEAS